MSVVAKIDSDDWSDHFKELESYVESVSIYNEKVEILLKDALESVEFSLDPCVLPGRKSITKENCGTIKKVITCKDHPNEYIIIRNYCYQPGCPLCFKMWAKKQGSIAGNKFMGFRKLLVKEGIIPKYYKRLARHYILSPPIEEAKDKLSDEGYKAFRTWGKEKAVELGIVGGHLVVHSKRRHCTRCDKDEYGCNCEDPTFHFVYSPHFHVVGYGFIPESEKGQEWVVKNLGLRESIGKTISYELSHAGLYYETIMRRKRRTRHEINIGVKLEDQPEYEVEQLQQSSIWFGVMRNGYLKTFREKDVEEVRCAICNMPYYELECGFSIDVEGLGKRIIESYDDWSPIKNKLMIYGKKVRILFEKKRYGVYYKGGDKWDGGERCCGETYDLEFGKKYLEKVIKFKFEIKDHVRRGKIIRTGRSIKSELSIIFSDIISKLRKKKL